MVLAFLRDRTSEEHLEDGWFFCPDCGGESEYRRIAVRSRTRFWGLLVASATEAELIECARCGARFEQSVLELSPGRVRSAEQRLRDAITEAIEHVFSLVLRAGGPIDDAAVEVFRLVLLSVAPTAYSAAGARERLLALGSPDEDAVLATVPDLARALGREKLAAAAAALARRPPSDAELRILNRVARALGMEETAMRDMVRQVASAR